MDFDTFVGHIDLGEGDPYTILDDLLIEYFPDVDISKIEYNYFSDEITWWIAPLNEYTAKILYMELKLLEREQKIKNLLNK